jgi:hypothetical protein
MVKLLSSFNYKDIHRILARVLLVDDAGIRVGSSKEVYTLSLSLT